jgi:amidase
MAATAVDHVVTRDQIVWAFGPDLEPVLEVDPGAVVRFETNDCFTGQIQGPDDLVTGIDMARVNSATGPVAVRGAEPGDSLVVEFLEVNPGPRGFATIIPGMGQLVEHVHAPVTQVFRVEDGVGCWSTATASRSRRRSSSSRSRATSASARRASRRPSA